MSASCLGVLRTRRPTIVGVPRVGVTADPASERAGHRVILTTLELQPTSKEVNPMADDRMAALELLRKTAGDGDLDFLREGLAMPHPAGHGRRGDGPDRGDPR